MAKIRKVLVLKNKISFTLSCGVYKNNHSYLVANIFDFLHYHVALQTTVIEVIRLAKEHRRMKYNFGNQ